MRKYVIVAESGADLSQAFIEQYGIEVLPMHVSVNHHEYLDGDISVTELVHEYNACGKIPMTSAVNPYQFQKAFEKIHAESPEAIILHIGYSSKTTSSYQNAQIASDGMKNIYHVDSLNVSIGQGFIITRVAKLIETRPDISVEEIISYTSQLALKARFYFVPGDLHYLRAGGRVSNAQFLGATLLRMKPLIEIQDGLLMTKGKYRGSMESISQQMINSYFISYPIDKEEIYLGYVHSISDAIKESMENQVKALGVKKVVWMQAGCVITSHAGPAGFGIAGISL
jgi:DegV family protein with EDD domain